MRRSLAVAALGVALCAGACTDWVKETVPAPPVPLRSMKGPVRVTLRDRTTVELVNVVIATDSLFGRSADVALIHRAYHLREVTLIEEKKKSPVRTLLLLGAIAVVLVTNR
jgi:hypothetical protein